MMGLREGTCGLLTSKKKGMEMRLVSDGGSARCGVEVKRPDRRGREREGEACRFT